MTPHHSPVFVPYRITCRLLVPSCVVSHNLATGHSKSYLPSSFQKEDLLTSTPFQTFRATCPWDISCWLFIPPSFPWDGGHTTFMKRTLDPGHRRRGRGQVSRADVSSNPGRASSLGGPPRPIFKVKLPQSNKMSVRLPGCGHYGNQTSSRCDLWRHDDTNNLKPTLLKRLTAVANL